MLAEKEAVQLRIVDKPWHLLLIEPRDKVAFK
jgi:hypothetical protein